MKIAVASDVHGLWFGLDYPDADLLVFAGDIFDYYDFDQQRNAKAQLDELKMFNKHLGAIKNRYKKIIVIAGNHDFVFQKFPDEARKILSNATYLQDEPCNFAGYKIYGSPWQPWFGGWAFNFPDHNANFFRARAHARKAWDKIPDDVNILITHGPALNVLDETSRGKKAGCQYLGERIEDLDECILHLCGHIHAARGFVEKDGLLSVNASNCYTHNKISYPMYIIEVDGDAMAKVIN
jgi:Icc-related predicted phosphoesterase